MTVKKCGANAGVAEPMLPEHSSAGWGKPDTAPCDGHATHGSSERFMEEGRTPVCTARHARPAPGPGFASPNISAIRERPRRPDFVFMRLPSGSGDVRIRRFGSVPVRAYGILPPDRTDVGVALSHPVDGQTCGGKVAVARRWRLCRTTSGDGTKNETAGTHPCRLVGSCRL